jgi:hypothetical protein
VEPTLKIDATAVLEPTPNIDATVEAKLAQERAVDATVEARLEEEKASKPTVQAQPANAPVATATLPPKPTPTPRPLPTATPTPIDTSNWYQSCEEESRHTRYMEDALNISWEFDRTPAAAGISNMFLRVSPSEHRNLTRGFGFLSLKQHEIDDLTHLSYQRQLANPSAYQLAVGVELVTEYFGGMTCISPMFSNLMYPEATIEERRLTAPEGINMDNSRYAEIVIPEPTLEALIFAFAEYKGRQVSTNGNAGIDYSIWRIYPEDTIEKYFPKLRLFLFGDGVDQGDWEAEAHILEILSVIKPELDPRFARDIDEVTLPVFNTFCETWMVPPYTPNMHCNMTSNAGYFSEGPTRHFADSRGLIWKQYRVATKPHRSGRYQIGDVTSSPCCSFHFHEFSHSVGLNHNYCAYSSVGRWENKPYMTKPFSEDDLAGMAVHLDSRTKHGMTIEEAADALGITRDERYDELVEKPWLACGEQHPTWEQFADLIYQDHISSDRVETNNR